MLAYANQYPGGRDPSIGREFKPAPGQRAVSPQKIERRERMRGFFEGKGNTAPRGEEDDDPLRPLRDPFEKDRYEMELIEKHRGSDVVVDDDAGRAGAAEPRAASAARQGRPVAVAAPPNLPGFAPSVRCAAVRQGG